MPAVFSAGLSTVPDNPGDSRFWPISPGLQIRIWNLPDNRQSLPFLVVSTFWQWNFKYFALFELFLLLILNVSSQTPVTIPTTSFLCIFFSQMTSCAVYYDIISHPFPINSQYLKMWGVDSPVSGYRVNWPNKRKRWQTPTWAGDLRACGFKVMGFVGVNSIPGTRSNIRSYSNKCSYVTYRWIWHMKSVVVDKTLIPVHGLPIWTTLMWSMPLKFSD